MSRKTLSARAAALLLSVITVFQLAVFFIGGTVKDGYHLDELFSYGLSNSTTGAFLYDNIGKWAGGSTFTDYLTVQSGEGFSYGKVYDNQVHDVHPPVFYFLLHTVCSFFPGVFSKWLGLSLNFLIFIFCQLVLYKLSYLLLRTRINALAACCLWGFSAGAFNTFIFIRMYALLTLFALLISLCHTKLLQRDRVTVRKMVPVAVTAIAGGLTHYYSLVFLFFLAAYTCVYLLIRRRFRDLALYIGAMAVSLGCIYLSFPAIVSHLSSDRGKHATASIFSLHLLWSRLQSMAGFIYRELIGLPAALLLLMGAAAGIAVFMLRRRREPAKQADQAPESAGKRRAFPVRIFPEHAAFTGLIIAALAAVCIIANISPDMGAYLDRYIFCTYPILCIALTSLLIFLINKIPFGDKARIAAVLTALILFASGVRLYPSRYLYGNPAERGKIDGAVAGADCVYVIPMDYAILTLGDAFIHSGRVFTTVSADTEQISRAVSDMDPSKKNLLIITDSCSDPDKSAALAASEAQTGYKADFLFKGLHGNDFFEVYALEAANN